MYALYLLAHDEGIWNEACARARAFEKDEQNKSADTFRSLDRSFSTDKTQLRIVHAWRYIRTYINVFKSIEPSSQERKKTNEKKLNDA